MNALLRKSRGVMGAGLAWGLGWWAIGTTLGLITGVVDPDSIDAGESPLVIGALIGLTGFAAGVGFGLLVAAAERRKALGDLSLGRVALWGALGAAALPLLTPMANGIALLVGPLGAAFAAGSVAIARGAARREQARLGVPEAQARHLGV